MPNPKTLAVGVAILTILGMTLALAVPMGPSFTGDDDPENSGVTSAQEDPVDNSTDNDTDDNSSDTDNDTDDDPEDNDGSGENDSSSGSDSSCESNSGSGESDCDSNGDDADDQDGEKDKDDDNGDDGSDGSNGDNGDDGAGDQDGEKDKDDDNGDDGGDGDNGAGDGDDNETNVPASCEENGLVQENTIANEAFGTENESGPISSELHANEEEFQDAYVIVHEGSCIVATVDNNADDGGDGDGSGDGNESDDGDGNESEDGSGDGDDTASTSTCEESGLVQENTIANEAFGTENESGPISEPLHDSEGEFQDAYVIVHEGSCIVATVDNNADDGGDGDGSDGDGNESDDGNDNDSDDSDDDDSDGNDGNGTDDGNDGNETDDGTEDGDEAGTCETDGAIQENTLANELFGTENEDGPFSSELHMNEGEFQDGDVLVHEGSCVIATVDNNASEQDGELATSA